MMCTQGFENSEKHAFMLVYYVSEDYVSLPLIIHLMCLFVF